MRNKELLNDLGKAREAGLVKSQTHPDLDLFIYNYTPQAAFTPGAFDDPVVRQARGLILDGKGKIVARPYEKFFNYGDPATGTLYFDVPVRVYDKVDGSLGILYPTGNGRYAVATRGSFLSDQAVHATGVWKEKYQGNWSPPKGFTALFEIIYPENRIVVDYEGMDDLVLLGMVNNSSGDIYPPEIWDYPGPVVEAFPYFSLREALEAEPRPNREGFVIQYPTGKMVKIKQEDYLSLHKAIFGLNERAVWEVMSTGQTLDSLLEKLPDEFHEWTKEVASHLLIEHTKIDTQAVFAYYSVKGRMQYRFNDHPHEARREFAEYAKETNYTKYLFMLLDGKDPAHAIWQSLRPKSPKGPFSESDSRIEEA